MNTISNKTNNIEVYLQMKVDAAKSLQQYKTEQQKDKDENNFISISHQGVQALNSSTQVALNSSPLDSLVESGTITQDQADAVQSVFQSRGKEIQSSGTYNNRVKSQNPLDSLVTAGTITQDQEDAIKSELQESMKTNRLNREEDPPNSTTQTDPLDNLVTAGTITQDREDAILSSFESAMNSKSL
jgi:polyhydroxyalkanoate synthesis regulator phasin